MVAGVLALIVLSPHMLLWLGYPYEAPLTGPFPLKIHPATYLVSAALVCALASRGNPLRAALNLAASEPLLALHLLVMVVCMAWVLARHGPSGAAFLVDTHWLPSLAAMALVLMDERRRASLLPLLAWAMGLNALLALVEFALAARMTPLMMAGQASGFGAEDHFRSSALFGHPLENALITGTLLPVALLMRRWSWGWRVLHVGLMLLALLAFGSRVGLFSALAVYGLWALVVLVRDTLRGRFNYLQLTGGAVLLWLGLVALVAVAVASGIGDRIFGSLYLDNSASVRVRVLSAYEFVDAEGLWLGISPREIEEVALRLGLDPTYEAIENGWIYLSLEFGLVVFAAWLLGFGCLITWLVRRSPPLVVLGVLVYLINSSTTNSFASKTVTKGLLVAYVVAVAASLRTSSAPVLPSAQGVAGRRRKPWHGERRPWVATSVSPLSVPPPGRFGPRR